MDYQKIATALDKRAATEIQRWDDYRLKHPRKSKGKAKPAFYNSLAKQLNEFLDNPNPRFPVPFTEKQARYVEKACPGAYAFIIDQQRASGQWMNHHQKCPVRLGLNDEMGLTFDAEGVITCDGCNAELGRLRVESEPFPINIDDLELPETINLDDFEMAEIL